MDKLKVAYLKIKNTSIEKTENIFVNWKKALLLFIVLMILIFSSQVGFALGFAARYIWEFFMLIFERLWSMSIS